MAGVGDNKRTERIARNSVQFVQDPASWAMMNQFPVCNLLSPSSISTTPLPSRLPPSDVFAFCDRRRGGKDQRAPLATSSLPRGWDASETATARGGCKNYLGRRSGKEEGDDNEDKDRFPPGHCQ